MMEKLISYRVVSSEHVEAMRIIYNDNLDMLATMPLPVRSYQDQQDWWKENHTKIRGYLYEAANKPGVPIAFLILTNRGRFHTPVFAIGKESWGKGFGIEIIKDYLRIAGTPLAGSQLQSNVAICHLNQKAGWQIVGSVDTPQGKIDLVFHPGMAANATDIESIREEIIHYLKLKHTTK